MMMRWLIDAPADGIHNMACDEALLERVGRGASPPTLRFYRWDPPTISLGYFQRFEDYASLAEPAGKLAVVRRQTGGGAILHDLELTYSLVLPLSHPLLNTNGGANQLYHHVHDVFAALLNEHGVPVTRGPAHVSGCSHTGPFFCFERHCAFDLLAEGKKLMGSAQRRTTGAVLQHGSLILDSRFGQQPCATVATYAHIDIDAHAQRLVESIAHEPVGDPVPLDRDERDEAQQLREKYASREWTAKR